jgi:hypothetical protein
MINLIQNFDEYSFPNEYQYYYSNEFNSSLLSRNENTFSLPLNESPIKQKNNNKLFITKKTMKEKIEHQKMKLGKDNNKEIYFDKKEDLKRRNREAAQNSRNKKKLEFNKLIEENKMLKDKIYIINSKINLLCSHCKIFFDIFEPNEHINCSNNDNNKNEFEDNNILNTHNTQSSSFFSNLKIQKLFNFALISLISILCLFCFLSNNNDSYLIRNNLEQFNETEWNKSNIYKEALKNKSDINEDKIKEKEFFNSFQCKKRSFASMMFDKYKNFEWNLEENNTNDNLTIEEKKENKIKNPIYFKLFVQSCSLDEEPENNNNKDYNIFINDNKHYVFSTDISTYQDFYFFCQETDY